MKNIFRIFLLLFAIQAYGQSNDSILAQLLNGNSRFMNQMALHPNDDNGAIIRTSSSQKPFALVHTCSDSRVAPELVFDQGIGDLFVTRVAGNVMGDGGLGSIEYAVEHLGVRFILILGHSKCGAVSATVSGKKASGHISWLVNKIKPSYKKVVNLSGDKIDLTIKENVKNSMSEVMKDRELLDLAIRNQIVIAGAVYHIEDGSIEIVVPPLTLDKSISQSK
jgi:carbonic anhydrase